MRRHGRVEEVGQRRNGHVRCIRAALLVACAVLLAGWGDAARASDVNAVIPNHLRQDWPWDLTYIKVEPSVADNLKVVEIQGHRRPVQIERTKENGKPVVRAWFVATIGEVTETNDKGKEKSVIPAEVPVRFMGGSIEPGIRMAEQGAFHIIENGVYEFRLRKSETFSEPIPLSKVPHWTGGARLKGTDTWDGRAWFEGSALVKGYSVEVLQQGAVFIDVEVTYDFVTETLGEVEALPLDMGKQTFLWEPNQLPRETLPQRAHAYTARLRFIMGQPVIEVNERFHLPRDPDAGSFGIHQYWFNWGEPADSPALPWLDQKEHVKIDTITWVRWFLYDQFGGNTNQNYVKAEPRPDQKGRPFALVRPRWNQGGGGAQDFIATSGGEPISLHKVLHDRRNGLVSGSRMRKAFSEADEDTKKTITSLLARAEDKGVPYRDRFKAASEAGALLGRNDIPLPQEGYSDENPAYGILALFSSKWVGPYPGTIATYALENNRARARFPLIDGERSQMHYGQRSWGYVVAPRSDMNHLNGVVRRFADWTLVGVTNKYITEWKRDPGKAGPNAYITNAQLETLRKAYKSGQGEVAEIIGEEAEALRKLLEKKEELDPRVKALNDARRDRDATDEARKEAEETWETVRNELRDVEKKLSSTDMELLRMIVHDWSKTVNPQTAQLWLERRYQDDFLNPTSRATRNVSDFAVADMFAGGKPIGGGMHAALGYIATDLDAWPGWHQGWSPGNPNFHTDKYMGAIYIGAAMRDHPHSDEWIRFGWENFQDDVSKVLLPPDGVGYECPGYSGYSLKHQLGLARMFLNAGFGNPVADNPLMKKTGLWHRKLITPIDYRLGLRHATPIGDTHRWTSGFGHGFGAMARFYAKNDPAFAAELQGTWHMLLEEGGLKTKNRLQSHLIEADPSIPATDPKEMDWSSDAFHGFGAIFRNHFGTKQESFLSIKAGPLHGHYHNDENSYHFYANGHPVSLDYNCSYTPRGDHAALHNTMTFGVEGQVRNNTRNENVPGMEQVFGSAWAGGFATTSAADVFVSERKASHVTMTPLYPEDHEFQRQYDSREVGSLVHRRYIMMVKHPVGSAFTDFLVVRDETVSAIPQAVNIHLLARESAVDGNLIRASGQYGVDMDVFVADATDLKIDNTRSWSYSDNWMLTPGTEYEYKPGESQAEWASRMDALKKKHNVKTLPLPGWAPRWRGGGSRGDQNPEFIAWQKLIKESGGKAMMPPPGWSEKWMYGEYQTWIRLESKPGTPILWVLYPYEKGTTPPTYEALANGTGVRVTLGGKSQEIYLSTDPADGIPGQAVLRRDGQEEVLFAPGTIPPIGQIKRQPLNRD